MEEFFRRWMDDCIHKKACYRMRKKARTQFGIELNIACNSDCTAYESIEDYGPPLSTDGWAFCKESGKYDKVRVTCFEPD